MAGDFYIWRQEVFPPSFVDYSPRVKAIPAKLIK